MTEEILQKVSIYYLISPLFSLLAYQLQDTAATLTADRKRRGKKPPEGLASADAISDYQQISTHPVECYP